MAVPIKAARHIVRLAHHLALYFSRHTPFHRSVTARLLGEYVARMIDIGFEPCPALDPQRDPPIVWLEQMQNALPGAMRHPPHEGIDILRRLLRKKEAYEAEIPLRAVVGVTASRGKLRMSLDSLPETMFLLPGDSFAPLDDKQMTRLKAAVMREFSSSSRDGVFHLDLQEWNGAYVAANTGASRRFALWRRLSSRELEPIHIKAVVTPYSLDRDALRELRDRFRLIYCLDNGLLGPFMEAEELLPNSFASLGDLSVGSFIGSLFLVPYTHCLPPRLAEPMSHLHRRIDEAGALDVGRFLTEQISFARRRGAASRRPARKGV